MMKLQGSCHCKLVRFEVESHTPYPFMSCYCSICRKTAGGGGYAINIMGEAETLKVEGVAHIDIYQAKIFDNDKVTISPARRHFCKNCASCLYITDPNWPQWVYPFASAIDTPLPSPPEHVYMMLDFAAPWCEIHKNANDQHFSEYPEESIEDWHRKRKLFIK